MDDNQRLHLQKMISANNVEDNTELIRQLKHSHILHDNVSALMKLKTTYPDDADRVHFEGMSECNFLFTYYTDLYNKIRKDEIELPILFDAIQVLRDIEDGKLDQHEGAFAFGTLLKKMYVDSALKKADKLNEGKPEPSQEYKGPQETMSWADFKKTTDFKKTIETTTMVASEAVGVISEEVVKHHPKNNKKKAPAKKKKHHK